MKTTIIVSVSVLFLLGSCGLSPKKDVTLYQDTNQTYRAVESNNSAKTTIPQQASEVWQSTEQTIELSGGFSKN